MHARSSARMIRTFGRSGVICRSAAADNRGRQLPAISQELSSDSCVIFFIRRRRNRASGDGKTDPPQKKTRDRPCRENCKVFDRGRFVRKASAHDRREPHRRAGFQWTRNRNFSGMFASPMKIGVSQNQQVIRTVSDLGRVAQIDLKAREDPADTDCQQSQQGHVNG